MFTNFQLADKHLIQKNTIQKNQVGIETKTNHCFNSFLITHTLISIFNTAHVENMMKTN
jgi:hypothetical protein